jgi:hypothetical protein
MRCSTKFVLPTVSGITFAPGKPRLSRHGPRADDGGAGDRLDQEGGAFLDHAAAWFDKAKADEADA